MKNLLIIEDDLLQSHFLANLICKDISDIRLYNVATTGMEALNVIKNQKVDIIILDLKLPDMTGIDIIDFIKKHNLKKYNSSIIVFTGEMNLLREVVSIGNRYVYNYCSKLNGIDIILKSIREIIYNKQKNEKEILITDKIKMQMQELNFNFSYIGTKYLCDCIEECNKKENIYNINLKKDIYSVLSKKYNKSINSIKSSIFTATTIMYYESDENKLSEYFGYRIISKPKTIDIIDSILQKIT